MWETLIVFAVIAVALLVVSRQFLRHHDAESDCKCGTHACQLPPALRGEKSCKLEDDCCSDPQTRGKAQAREDAQ